MVPKSHKLLPPVVTGLEEQRGEAFSSSARVGMFGSCLFYEHI